MRAIKSLFLPAAAICLFCVSIAGAETVFTLSDVEGEWVSLALYSGDRTGEIVERPRIEYGTLTVNAAARSAVKTYTSYYIPLAQDAAVPTVGQETWTGLEMGTDGVLSRPEAKGYTFDYAVSKDKKTMAGTDTYEGFRLEILLKKQPQVVFSPGDLAGEWYFHSLVSGDVSFYYSPTEHPGMAWGTVNFTANGTGGYTAIYSGWKTEGVSYEPLDTPTTPYHYPFSDLVMGADGVIRDPFGEFFHYQMSGDKDVIVGVRREYGSGSRMEVLVRKSSERTGAFSVSDAYGSWEYHALVTGDWPQNYTWEYGTREIGKDGSGEVSWRDSRDNPDVAIYTGVPTAFLSRLDPDGRVETVRSIFTMTMDKEMLVGIRYGKDFSDYTIPGGFCLDISFHRDPPPEIDPFRSAPGSGGCFVDSVQSLYW
ncbi:MAG: hypothetical protein JRI97_12760 [Deltaproteobacteria bacterium]|nr:hypothetical protein [Deltaproteobacteria bacterium]